MVEAAGIEPASKGVSSEPSPGADGYFGLSPVPRAARKPSRASVWVASLCVAGSKLCLLTDATK